MEFGKNVAAIQDFTAALAIGEAAGDVEYNMFA